MDDVFVALDILKGGLHGAAIFQDGDFDRRLFALGFFGGEAQQQNGVRRVLVKWMRYDVIALDEVGYVPPTEIGAGFLFRVIARPGRTRHADLHHESAVF